ncbi:MAG: secretin N-terminal domain-containing protein [Nitrospinales bacterium]
MKKLLGFTLIFIFLASYASAQTRVEVIKLKHRTAEELIPLLQPILGEGGTITGSGYTLILKAAAREMNSAKQVLAQLDTSLRNLRIIVKQGTRSQLNASSANLSARVPLGNNGTLRVNPGAPSGPGLNAGYYKDGYRVRGNVNEERFSTDNMQTQQVVTLEGRPAMIHIGQRIPFQTFTPNQGTSVQFQDVRKGFSVLPRVNGNNVTIDIHPENSEVGPGGINFQEVHTMVNGRLGEWIEIGSLAEDHASGGRGILSGSQVRSNDRRTVFIQVLEEKN